MTAILLLALAAATPAGFAPLAPLIGHCWRGTLPNGASDTHCFAWTGRRVVVRDTHVVTRDGRAVYRGETDYTLVGGGLRWDYRNAGGPVMAGGVAPAPGELRFTVDGGPSLAWRWRGRRAYLADTGPKAEPVLFCRVR